MLGLSPEEHEMIRASAAAISSQLSKEDREDARHAAAPIANALRALCMGDEVTGARVAQVIAALFAELQALRVEQLSSTLDGSCAAYALAAGGLAGVYALPDVPDKEPGIDLWLSLN